MQRSQSYEHKSTRIFKTTTLGTLITGLVLALLFSGLLRVDVASAEMIEPPITETPTDEPTDEPTETPTDKPTDKPTETPTDKPTEEPVSSITIIKKANPESTTKFIFKGQPELGKFKLDGKDNNAKTFHNVEPGVEYTFTEQNKRNWELTNIECEATGNSTTDVDVDTRSATVMIAEMGDEITCTFTNRKMGTIVVKKYNDQNENGKRNNGEPFLSGWEFSVYNGNELVGQKGTNHKGKAAFNGLKPGTHRVCETPKAGWTNTAPAGTYAWQGLICADVEVSYNKISKVWFGNHWLPTCTMKLNGDPTFPNTAWDSVDTLTDVVQIDLQDIVEPVSYRWKLTFPTDRSGTAPEAEGNGEFTENGSHTIEIPYPPKDQWGTPSKDGHGTYESHVTLWISAPCDDKDWDHWYKAPFETDLEISKTVESTEEELVCPVWDDVAAQEPVMAKVPYDFSKPWSQFAVTFNGVDRQDNDLSRWSYTVKNIDQREAPFASWSIDLPKCAEVVEAWPKNYTVDINPPNRTYGIRWFGNPFIKSNYADYSFVLDTSACDCFVPSTPPLPNLTIKTTYLDTFNNFGQENIMGPSLVDGQKFVVVDYQIEVTNNGPWNAQVFEDRGTLVEDTLPEGAELISMTPSQGSCDTQTATCDLGELKYLQSATIEVVAKVTYEDALKGVVNTATVTPERPQDTNPDNNTDTAELKIEKPAPETNCTYDEFDWAYATEWPLDTIEIGGVTLSEQEARALYDVSLTPPPSLSQIVALEVLTAKLNIAKGADGSAVAEALAAADMWLTVYPVGTYVDYETQPDAFIQGGMLALTLYSYNNGDIGPGQCICETEQSAIYFNSGEGGTIDWENDLTEIHLGIPDDAFEDEALVELAEAVRAIITGSNSIVARSSLNSIASAEGDVDVVTSFSINAHTPDGRTLEESEQPLTVVIEADQEQASDLTLMAWDADAGEWVEVPEVFVNEHTGRVTAKTTALTDYALISGSMGEGRTAQNEHAVFLPVVQR